ncbi:hypothetical protein FRB94_007039 [Tulasnella sp. JGI-2019a]|nr:hypothetical protein FRB94_007039 [Tulasnella sp. JGI-2019a]
MSTSVDVAGVDPVKMTVPSLKLMCKNRGLLGYSKLKKQALIDLLSKSLITPAGGATEQIASFEYSMDPTPPSSNTNKWNNPESAAAALAVTPLSSFTSSQTLGKRHRSPDDTRDGCPGKRPALTVTTAAPTTLTPLGPVLITADHATFSPTRNYADASQLPLSASHSSAQAYPTTVIRTPTIICPSNAPCSTPTVLLKRPFRKLTFLPKHIPIEGTRTIDNIPATALADIRKTLSLAHGQCITLPASYSQHKPVRNLAVVFSLMSLSKAELSTCVLVSKAWRHAALLSAQPMLHARFSGDRLSAYLLERQDSTHVDKHWLLNAWPYLHERKRQLARIQIDYSARFLSKICIPTVLPIANALWTNPDHPDQMEIACRIAVAISQHAVRLWSKWQVVAVTAIKGEDIWRIVTKHGKHAQIHLVLAASGEVIGRDPKIEPATRTDERLLDIGISVRSDWSAFIHSRFRSDASTATPSPPLAECVHCQNVEEFRGGISKAWLQRIEWDLDGDAKLAIAKRYVIANAVPNSVSGRYKTTMQMVQSLNGPDDAVINNKLGVEQRVNLFVAT